MLGREYERVPVDIFGGETLTDAFAAINPARAVPVLEAAPGRFLPESNAIMLALAEGTPFLPGDQQERWQVYRWLLFEQADVVATIGGLRFSPPDRPPERRRRGAPATRRRGHAARARRPPDAARVRRGTVLDRRHLPLRLRARRRRGGHRPGELPGVSDWLRRVEAQDGFVNDLEPYPANARPGAGRSIYD